MDTLYDRLGGEAGIATLIDRFYERVTADPELAPFFQNVSMDKLRHMQRRFFTAALGGPEEYGGRPLHHAHAGLGIETRHFSRFAYHLVETLRAAGAKDDDVDAVAERIAVHADDITGESTTAG